MSFQQQSEQILGGRPSRIGKDGLRYDVIPALNKAHLKAVKKELDKVWLLLPTERRGYVLKRRHEIDKELEGEL